jgi:glycosyltransferase involved in cell wall biosynthesis
MVTHELPGMGIPSLTSQVKLAPVARQVESLRSTGVEVDVLEVKGSKGIKYLQCLSRLRTLASKVDLIHAHYGFCGWVARGQFGKPVVVSFMGSDLLGGKDANGRVGLFRKFEVKTNQWLARTVDTAIVKSAEMAKVVVGARVHIIPNGVDLEAFRPMCPSEARALLGWAEGKIYVLFPSSPNIPGKGFALAGAVIREAATQMTQRLELVPLGNVAPNRVPVFMNGCHALLMTSFSEGSPNVVKEAMACNLPVVSVPVGDVPELLAGVKECTVCPRNVQMLSEALVKALVNNRRADGRLALERKGLSLMDVARRVKSIYERVLADARN